jgi:hypothetical protein
LDSCFILLIAFVLWALFVALMATVKVMEASDATMTITTRSSTRVKPGRRDLTMPD